MLLAHNHFCGGDPAIVRIDESENPPGTNPGHTRYVDYLANTVGDDQRDLEPSDFEVVWMVPDSVHRVQRRDGTCYRVHADNSISALPDFTVSNEP